MHNRKGALASSLALVSLKLCIFFPLFSAFFCPFSTFFCLFSASFCPFFPFPILFYPLSDFSRLIFCLITLSPYLSLLPLFLSLFFLFISLTLLYICVFLFPSLFILNPYSFYPCFIYRIYNVLSVYNFFCAFRLCVPLINFFYSYSYVMCSRCSDYSSDVLSISL